MNQVTVTKRTRVANSRRITASQRATLAQLGWLLMRDVASLSLARELAKSLGPLMRQHNGRHVHVVKASSGGHRHRYTHNNVSIGLHTEAPNFSTPPSFVALYCVRQDRLGTGHTTLVDLEQWIRGLSLADRELAANATFRFCNRAIGGGQETGSFKILERRSGGGWVVRFSHNLLTYGDINPAVDATPRCQQEPSVAEVGARILEFATSNQRSILIPERGLLVWDNRRLLHGRDDYLDRARELHRFWIGPPERHNWSESVD